jgi:hypothetical protein
MTTTSFSEGNYAAEFLITEGPNTYSRDPVTVISGQTLVAGAVLGKITASGKVTLIAPAASDGSEVAYGILLAPVDASAADTAGTAIVRLAEINAAKLAWGSATAPQKATALATLKTLGVIAR